MTPKEVWRGGSVLPSASSCVHLMQSAATLCSSSRDLFVVGAHPILAFQVQLLSIQVGLRA